MPSPTQDTKAIHTAPHPHLEETPIDTKTRSGRASPEKKSTTSSQERPRDWHQVSPSLGPEIVVEIESYEASSVEQALPPPYNHNRDSTTRTEEGTDASSNMNCEKLGTNNTWSVPHAVEYQKHAWYGALLGMGSKKVKDDWGFSSASVSRSHSPNNRT
ncbi:hypothetical protein BDW02DRAFT_234097 [Decorospora gaudefroyi]|uniref:Uncharacterized protein n=1 Tax=Decorospora gaudefroyi TaxID=184978 RepID=A0A6A5KLF7_9PLEO|nr:hypothetical protein BDW02DRAFT_234097 [Decorospora gaudefroyi]